ncbi:hypothetical protein ABZ759_10240 [Streptomyces sp. NPDC047860]|uniref:hypothetical protein n=1 Tax=Streptomyces sp. NPDC047860 TaxID=3155743 RepID=UPI0033F9C5E2
MPRHAGDRAPAFRRARPLVLAGVAGVAAACAFALPLKVESAGTAGRRSASGPANPAPAVRSAPPGDGTARTATTGAPASPAPHLSTAQRCGPAVSSPDGIEARTCVVAQGEEVWSRTYYRNATGEPRAAALSFMGPGGRTVRTHCAVDAGDEPALCETPRERGGLARHTAVAEFAYRAGRGLLLRSGSN